MLRLASLRPHCKPVLSSPGHNHRLYAKRITTSFTPAGLLSPTISRSFPAHLSTATLHPHNLFRRTVNYFNDYPFVKYSILLCAAVLGGSLAFESYNKHKKKRQPQILSLPAQVGHATLPRLTELRRLRDAVRLARKGGEGVVYLVGPPGSGKTEIVCEYGKHFIDQIHNFTYRFRITKPAVLYLNGTSCQQLHISLQEVALCLGIKADHSQPNENILGREEDMVSLAKAVWDKLSSNGVPWLIVVDNLTPSATPTFRSLFHANDREWNWARGHVVVTTRECCAEGDHVVRIDSSLETDEAMSLLQKLSPSTDFSAVDPHKLSPLLSSTPLALALAASTINLYTASLEQQQTTVEVQPSPLAEYLDLLEDHVQSSPSGDVTAACINLYVEAAATQPRVLHTFDLLGALSFTHPVPVSVVDRHLSSSFYRLAPLDPPALPIDPQQDPRNMSYYAQLKMLLPFGNKPSPAPSPLAGFDRLHYLRQSPLLGFKKYSKEGFELLQLQPMAGEELLGQFLSRSVPLLDHAHLKEAEEVFNNTAWFRQYRTFDGSKSLTQYWSSLPGVAGSGVMTREQFQNSQVRQNLQYSEYLHIISHNHRIVSSIVSDLKLLDDGFFSTQYCRYIQPHLSHLSTSDTIISESDRVMSCYGLASVAAVISPDSAATVELYQSVLEKQQSVLGPNHPAVARTLADMAVLLFAKEDIAGARNLLESALHIYQAISPKLRTAEVSIDYGLAMTSLAVVVSTQGEKKWSQELLDEALGLYQAVPESGEVSIHQRRLVATTLVDLAHAYLTLGQMVMAKKYIELAVMALPSVCPEGSEEMVRALTVAGTVYALLGDRRESQRLGEEAGKYKAKLEKQQLAFV